MTKISAQRFFKKWRTAAFSLVAFTVIMVGVLIALPRPFIARAAASGGWSTYLNNNGRSGFNGAETVINPTSAPHLKLHWSYQSGGIISTQVVAANGLLYWGSWDGYEHATKLNGTQVWQQNLGQTTDTNCFPPTVGVASTATVASMTVGGTKTPVIFVGGGAADFYALNANTGAVIWRTPLGTSPDYFTWASPNIYKGSVYVGLASFGDCPLVHGQLIQMNASTGAIQHVFDVAPKGCKSGGVWGSSTIDETDGSVYFGTGNGKCNKVAPLYSISLVKLRASDLTYLSSWQIPLAQRTTADNSFGSIPTLFQATINGAVHQLVGIDDENGMYYAFDRTNISNGPVWQDAVANTGSCPECGDGSISPSAWDGSTLYVAGGNTTINGTSCKGSLRAVDPATGTYLWQDCFPDGPVLGAVSAALGVAVVGEGKQLIVVATATGSTLFTFAASGVFYAAASISHGVLYVGNVNKTLYAFGTEGEASRCSILTPRRWW